MITARCVGERCPTLRGRPIIFSVCMWVSVYMCGPEDIRFCPLLPSTLFYEIVPLLNLKLSNLATQAREQVSGICLLV